MRISAHPTDLRATDPRAGFTLVEVLVSILILGVMGAMLSLVLQGSLRIHAQQTREPERIREREEALARQFAGEAEEPVITLKPVEEE